MIAEFRETLLQYLSGSMTIGELAETVASYDIWNGWQKDDAEIRALRPLAGRIELLTTEVLEELRPVSDLRGAIGDILASPAEGSALSAYRS